MMGQIGCARIRVILDRGMQRFGWSGYSYTFTVSQDWTAPGAHYVMEASRSLSTFLRRYRQLGLGQNLHRLSMVKSDLPQTYRVADFPSSRADRLLADLCAECGIRSGLMFPLYGYGGALGLITYTACEETPDPGRVAETVEYIRPLHPGMNARARELIGAADAGFALTAREVECLVLVAEGRTSREIAATVGITQRTVEFHIQNAIHKLDCTSRSQAASRLAQLGLSRAVATSARALGA